MVFRNDARIPNGFYMGHKYTAGEAAKMPNCKNREYTDEMGKLLVLCKGPIIKPYFKHYASEHTAAMSEWHKNWQSHFASKETIYSLNPDAVKTKRRADVDLDDTHVVEFQYSPISKLEVDERMHDWGLCNKKIIWVIYADRETVDVTQLDESGRTFIEYTKHRWMFESFTNYGCVFLDLDGDVYVINPQSVRSMFTETKAPIPKAVVVELLLNGIIESLCSQLCNVVPTTLYVKQQGAGNGKTFSVIQLLTDTEFAHVNTFIFLTKQHSAVHVIQSEIKDQQARGLLDDIKVETFEVYSKKYIITCVHVASGELKKIVIGTMDSFMYIMGNQNAPGVDKFKAMVRSVIDDEVRCTPKGFVEYAKGVHLNKRLLLVGDEMQDLDVQYTKAILKISREKYVDFYAVGDKLQSISVQHNAFTYLIDNELPREVFQVRLPPFTNVNRRITATSRPTMVPFINNMVPFEKFGLPPIEGTFAENDGSSTVTIIKGRKLYGVNKQSPDILREEVDLLMKHYTHEVDTCGRRPKDFLVVTPVVHKNPLMEAFHIRIREFWESRVDPDDHKYTMWSVFHKSEEGTSIDLSESDEATRIVSIHSSKGDGRPVVFVIGLSQFALSRYSHISKNLVYESLLHVALTRAKETMYVRYECDAVDDISNRIQKCGRASEERMSIADCLPIIQFKDLKDFGVTHTDSFEKFNDIFIKKSAYATLPDTQNRPMINNKALLDMKHHCVRYATFKTIICIEILDHAFERCSHNNQMIFQCLRSLFTDFQFKNYDNSNAYHKALCKKLNDTVIIPMLQYKTFGGDYESYFSEMRLSRERWANAVRFKMNNRANGTRLMNGMGYMDTLVLHHLIQIKQHREYGLLPITDLYDIFHMDASMNDVERDQNVIEHYANIEKTVKIVASLFERYPNMKFALDNPVKFKGGNTDFVIRNQFDFIGHDDDTIVLCYVKPQLNELNYNDIVFTTLFHTFLVMHADKDDHMVQFKGKRIVACIFTFDNDCEPYFVEWPKEQVLAHASMFVSTMKDALRFECTQKSQCHECMYTLYLSVYEQGHDVANLLDTFRKSVEHVKHKVPTYVDQFFVHVDFQNDDSIFLERLAHDKAYFMSQVEKWMDKAIDRYFSTVVL
jgi:hypothetical protein